MDFLTIDFIKTQCRIEDYSKDPERQRKIDSTIKKCADIAEKFVYEHIGKDYQAIMKEYGEIPIAIKLSALIVIEELVKYADLTLERDPLETYPFKMMLKPYKKRQ